MGEKKMAGERVPTAKCCGGGRVRGRGPPSQGRPLLWGATAERIRAVNCDLCETVLSFSYFYFFTLSLSLLQCALCTVGPGTTTVARPWHHALRRRRARSCTRRARWSKRPSPPFLILLIAPLSASGGGGDEPLYSLLLNTRRSLSSRSLHFPAFSIILPFLFCHPRAGHRSI